MAELQSDKLPEQVAAVFRNAENGCFVLQSILNPVPFERKFTLNSVEFDSERSSKTNPSYSGSSMRPGRGPCLSLRSMARAKSSTARCPARARPSWNLAGSCHR